MLKSKAFRGVLATASAAAFMVAGTTSADGATQAGAATDSVTASCTYNGCTTKDPQATGCSSGSQTVKNFATAAGVRVELRYSSACKAYWVRTSSSCVPLNRPYMETGYIDYYGSYRVQGIYRGKWSLGGCTGGDNPPTEVYWTAMTSASRERIRYGVDDHGTVRSYVYLTGCNDCTG